ncbi:MAG: ATP-binding cassette domain-containing protein, partial [Gammaproteobacteria bacterium]|nr:ATP-binding cassette domain-containing protein [Gammaproteobacteria bacterium]
CRGVGKSFGNFVAVRDVSMAVKNRSMHALIGPNGAGKTSLFNIMSGEYPSDCGEICFAGKKLNNITPDSLSRQGIARSFQITNVFPNLTVAENIRLAVQSRRPQAMNFWSDIRSFSGFNEETGKLVEFLGLEGLEEITASDLSYGGQRLLEIGLAVATRPRVLLLDEPLVGLADQERERVIGLIKSLAEFIAVLLIEHDIDRVLEFSDFVTVMNQAGTLTSGTPNEVREDERVQVAYLGSGKKLIARRREIEARAASEKIMLQVSGIDTSYGKSRILNNVSVDVRRGEAVALLGRNGAGKSTVLKSIMSIAPITNGRIVLDGREIQDLSPEQIACLGVGFVPQGRRLFANLTVEENLKLGALKRAGATWSMERIYEQFPRVRDRLHSRADTLSGGEAQMVAIARALVGDVKIILMDEPFEGLSPVMCEELFDCISGLRGEVSIVIIEHQLDLVLALANRVFVLDQGAVSHEGMAQPLLENVEFRKEKLWI